MDRVTFEWDSRKDLSNQDKHGVSFAEAQYAFLDPHRVIAEDRHHSTEAEKRYFCFGEHGGDILTVRFTYRRNVIRIFGAGRWSKGRRIYGKANSLHGRTDRPDQDR
jgi:uncharacterized DUF497 family protein